MDIQGCAGDKTASKSDAAEAHASAPVWLGVEGAGYEQKSIVMNAAEGNTQREGGEEGPAGWDGKQGPL